MRRKNLQNCILPTIAQIILAIWLLPFLCFIMSKLIPADGPNFFNILIEQIPITDTWLGIVTNFSAQKNAPLSEAYLISMIWSSIEETFIIGMWLEAWKKIGNFLGIKGAPILQTVIAVLLGCFTLANMDGDLFYTVSTGIFLLLLNALLILFTSSRGILLTCLLGILELALHCCVACFSVCYVGILLLILHGLSAWVAFPMLLSAAIPMLFVLVCDYIIF